MPATLGANGLWAPSVVKVGTPPRCWRVASVAWVLLPVIPLMKRYEYMGLMSKPLNGVISGLMMIAKLSPRVFGWQGTSAPPAATIRSEEHTSELQSHVNLVCRLLLE